MNGEPAGNGQMQQMRGFIVASGTSGTSWVHGVCAEANNARSAYSVRESVSPLDYDFTVKSSDCQARCHATFFPSLRIALPSWKFLVVLNGLR